MTIESWLSLAQKKLQGSSESPRLDSILLLSLALNKQREYILAHPEDRLKKKDLQILSELISRRETNEPMAYIRGKKEFYGREFIVNNSVLIPRPESETIIDILKTEYPKNPGLVLDIGTGSGSLAITASLELKVNVEASDIDSKALEVAKINVKKHRAQVNLITSDLLTNLSSKYMYFLANLPYLPSDMILKKDLDYEPTKALFAKDAGLELIFKLLATINNYSEDQSILLIEALGSQHQTIIKEAKKYGWQLLKKEGLIVALKNY